MGSSQQEEELDVVAEGLHQLGAGYPLMPDAVHPCTEDALALTAIREGLTGLKVFLDELQEGAGFVMVEGDELAKDLEIPGVTGKGPGIQLPRHR